MDSPITIATAHKEGLSTVRCATLPFWRLLWWCVCVSETPTILDGISFNGKHLGFKVLTGRPITSKNLVLRYRLLNVEKYRIPLAKVLTCFNHQKLEVNKQAWDFNRQNSRYCLYKCRLAFGNYHKGWDAM